MEVKDIPSPAPAAIKVTKDDKSAVFNTTVIHTTDNKYIYTMPVRIDKKLINFEVKGCTSELKIECAPFEFYAWKRIYITKFIEDGKIYLRIRVADQGERALAWPDSPVTSLRKPRVRKPAVQEEPTAEQAAN